VITHAELEAASPTLHSGASAPAPPLATPSPAVERRGVIHDAAKRRAVYWLAMFVSGIALVNFSLFVADAVLDAQELRPTGVSNWAFVLLLIGLVQGVYAFYLVQLPDWSTVWVASIVMLIAAAAHAMLLTVLALGGGNTPLAAGLQLDEFADQRPELVCLIMLSLTGLLSYLLGRASFRWRKNEAQLAATVKDAS
jgi:hypothetical protein